MWDTKTAHSVPLLSPPLPPTPQPPSIGKPKRYSPVHTQSYYHNALCLLQSLFSFHEEMLIFCAHSVLPLSLPLCTLSLTALTPSVHTQSLCSHSLRLLQSGNQKANLLCTLSLTACSRHFCLFQLGNQEARHLSPVHTRSHCHHPVCLLQSGNANFLCPLCLTALCLLQ